MKILYIDESGTANNSQNDIFTLAGMMISLHRFKYEVPLFNDSRTSRCLQMVDLIAYSEWRAKQKNDTRFLFSNLN